jgi:hypothetical protein
MTVIMRRSAKSICRECGIGFAAHRAGSFYCSAKCRSRFHNRRAQRGAELFDLFMAMRFDRASAEAAGAWSLMCRMAAAFKCEDDRERDGRQSWDDVETVKARNSHLMATVVANNLTGLRR